MKILYLLNQFPELSQTFVVDEILDLVSRGENVRVISRKRPDNPYVAGDETAILASITHYAEDFQAPTVPFPRLARAVLAGAGKLASAARGRVPRPAEPAGFERLERAVAVLTGNWGDPDVTQCHFGPMGAMAAILKEKGTLRGRISTVFHGYDVTKGRDVSRWNSYEHLFSVGDRFIAISDLWCRRLMEMGAPVSKISAVKLGIDMDAFEYRDRTRLHGEPFRIVSVGRMTQKKGHEFTIRAVNVIKKYLVGVDLKVDIVGDGELLHDMQQLVQSLDLSETITLHGGVDRAGVMSMLDKANLFVLHSVTAESGDREGIPVSIMEAMAMGLPVASTKHSGIPELVKDGDTGLLAAERDYIGFTECIADIATNPAKAFEMGRRGRERVASLHDRKVQSNLMHELLTATALGHAFK